MSNIKKILAIKNTFEENFLAETKKFFEINLEKIQDLGIKKFHFSWDDNYSRVFFDDGEGFHYGKNAKIIFSKLSEEEKAFFSETCEILNLLVKTLNIDVDDTIDVSSDKVKFNFGFEQKNNLKNKKTTKP